MMNALGPALDAESEPETDAQLDDAACAMDPYSLAEVRPDFLYTGELWMVMVNGNFYWLHAHVQPGQEKAGDGWAVLHALLGEEPASLSSMDTSQDFMNMELHGTIKYIYIYGFAYIVNHN